MTTPSHILPTRKVWVTKSTHVIGKFPHWYELVQLLRALESLKGGAGTALLQLVLLYLVDFTRDDPVRGPGTILGAIHPSMWKAIFASKFDHKDGIKWLRKSGRAVMCSAMAQNDVCPGALQWALTLFLPIEWSWQTFCPTFVWTALHKRSDCLYLLLRLLARTPNCSYRDIFRGYVEIGWILRACLRARPNLEWMRTFCIALELVDNMLWHNAVNACCEVLLIRGNVAHLKVLLQTTQTFCGNSGLHIRTTVAKKIRSASMRQYLKQQQQAHDQCGEITAISSGMLDFECDCLVVKDVVRWGPNAFYLRSFLNEQKKKII